MSSEFTLEIKKVSDLYVVCSLMIDPPLYRRRCNRSASYAVVDFNGHYLWRCGNHRDKVALARLPENDSTGDYTTTVPRRVS